MPSVGMRRSTRVLGARVLRSGRRLLTEPREGVKHIRAANVENKWIELIDNLDADDEFKNVRQANKNENGDAVEIVVDPKIEEFAPEDAMEVDNENNNIYGKVYMRRKRKRVELLSTGLPEDKRFGKKYVRKQWRRKCGAFLDSGFRGLAIVVNESSYDCGYLVASFLTTVLNYISRVRIGICRLSEFVLSRPISGAYSSRGVLFLQDSITIKDPGFCIIWGCRSFIPLFTVDFSAIPFSFMALHTSMIVRSIHLSCLLVTFSMAVDENNEEPTDMVDDFVESSIEVSPGVSHSGFATFSTHVSSWKEISHCDEVESGYGNSGIRQFLPKSSHRNIQLRHSRKIRKRRSSLRRKKRRPPSTFRAHKASGTLASDFVRISNDTVQLSPSPPSRVLRSLRNIKEPNSDVSVNRCSANLLIIETDKCYRDEGVTITLELSSSNRWFLAVMKNGIKRYSLPSQRVMRPAWINRFSHATVWVAEPTLKLEFPNKQDWLVFKELYKECSDRNMRAPPAVYSVIPVPGVQEVSRSFDSNNVPYMRPHSYITVKHDELTRALVKKSATYDMDSDDDEWLAKFNSELSGGSGDPEIVTPDSFEMIIDAIEKGFHSNQNENFDEQASYEFCVHIEKREMVVDAIRSYWVMKRTQKRSALVRIFQLYQPRRTEVIPKPVLRKKRSFKRQSSQGGRGNQRAFLQGVTAELQKQKNTQKVEEAKAAAERCEALAIAKRQRAQMLMENADLATYKAMVALKIAEAAQITPDKVSSFLLV